MKFFVLLAAIFSCSLALEIFDLESLDLENAHFDLDKELVESFIQKYEVGDEAGIVAIVDEYADKIFENIHEFALANGLDPVNLSDVNEHFLTASIQLSHGLLNGISTIQRSDSVEVSYRSSERLLEFYLPIVFSNLNFTYDYDLVILLIGPTGSMTGKIQNFEMDIKLLFDFNTYHATVESINTRSTGHVDLIFHGNGILDLVVNILSEFVTTILHPIIVLVIESIVSTVANTVCTSVNDFLDELLHPTTEATTVFTEDNLYLF